MKPHYRLHCNFGDAKPLWWVEWLSGWKSRVTGGYRTAAGAIEAAARL